MGDNLLSVKEDSFSNASTCGSERSATHLNSGSSSVDSRSSNTELNQIIDENDNFELSGTLWGERTDERNLSGSRVASEPDDDTLAPDHLDHAYIRGNYSSDPDLMSWYCLGTC